MVNTALNYLKQNKNYAGDLSYFDNGMHPVSDENPDVNLLGARPGRPDPAIANWVPDDF